MNRRPPISDLFGQVPPVYFSPSVPILLIKVFRTHGGTKYDPPNSPFLSFRSSRGPANGTFNPNDPATFPASVFLVNDTADPFIPHLYQRHIIVYSAQWVVASFLADRALPLVGFRIMPWDYMGDVTSISQDLLCLSSEERRSSASQATEHDEDTSHDAGRDYPDPHQASSSTSTSSAHHITNDVFSHYEAEDAEEEMIQVQVNPADPVNRQLVPYKSSSKRQERSLKARSTRNIDTPQDTSMPNTTKPSRPNNRKYDQYPYPSRTSYKPLILRNVITRPPVYRPHTKTSDDSDAYSPKEQIEPLPRRPYIDRPSVSPFKRPPKIDERSLNKYADHGIHFR